MFVAKYSASGNDFVIFHTFVEKDRSELAKKICNRFEGVGADGLVVVLPHSSYDFQWQFYNSDGSEASMCGNASRAVSHYAKNNGLCENSLSFLTQAGVIQAAVEGDFVTTDLTPPKTVQEDIKEDGKTWSLLDTGVPHLVAQVDDIEIFDLNSARNLRQKYNANINIWKKTAQGIEVRTYERGVEDETLACGTGMAACFLQGFNQKILSSSVKAFPKSKECLHLSIKDNVIKFGGVVKEVFVTQFKD